MSSFLLLMTIYEDEGVLGGSFSSKRKKVRKPLSHSLKNDPSDREGGGGWGEMVGTATMGLLSWDHINEQWDDWADTSFFLRYPFFSNLTHALHHPTN